MLASWVWRTLSLTSSPLFLVLPLRRVAWDGLEWWQEEGAMGAAHPASPLPASSTRQPNRTFYGLLKQALLPAASRPWPTGSSVSVVLRLGPLGQQHWHHLEHIINADSQAPPRPAELQTWGWGRDRSIFTCVHICEPQPHTSSTPEGSLCLIPVNILP